MPLFKIGHDFLDAPAISKALCFLFTIRYVRYWCSIFLLMASENHYTESEQKKMEGVRVGTCQVCCASSSMTS